MQRCIALLVFISVLLPGAQAAPRDFNLAFSEGAYGEAHDTALLTPTPDGLAFAARSLLAAAVTDAAEDPSLELILQAQALAHEALRAQSDHVEGRLQLAIALSLEARGQSARKVWRSGAGKTARNLAESVILDDPSNSYAHGFLAVWHLEVRRRGGRLGASLFGASVNQAEKHYRLAVASDPNDAALHWQYARALTALDASKFRSEIDLALQASIAAAPRSKLEHVMQARAIDLRQRLNHDTHRAAQLYAAKML